MHRLTCHTVGICKGRLVSEIRLMTQTNVIIRQLTINYSK